MRITLLLIIVLQLSALEYYVNSTAVTKWDLCATLSIDEFHFPKLFLTATPKREVIVDNNEATIGVSADGKGGTGDNYSIGYKVVGECIIIIDRFKNETVVPVKIGSGELISRGGAMIKYQIVGPK